MSFTNSKWGWLTISLMALPMFLACGGNPSQKTAQTETETADAEETTASITQDRYKVGVCDWMILKRQKIGAFELAAELGADGIELDMGSLGDRRQFDSKLDDSLGRNQFLDEAAKYDLQIASIAMSGFYGQNFATRDEYKELTVQAIHTAKAMGTKIVFLPLGVANPKAHPELRATLVQRLKEIGELAAREGIVLAVASSLPSAEEVNFLKEINSKGVKASINFSDIIENREDIGSALMNYGKDYIAQIHCSNTDGYWIENDPEIHLPSIKQTLDAMGWCGWLLIERSRDSEMIREVKTNYSANVKYVKSIFQPE